MKGNESDEMMTFCIRVPKSLLQRLRADKDRTGVPISVNIRRAIDERLRRREKKADPDEV